jgi:hypothetical protein
MAAARPPGSERSEKDTVERLTLVEVPEVGATTDARDARWRITRVRLPLALDVHGDVVYDMDVEPVGSTPQGTSSS